MNKKDKIKVSPNDMNKTLSEKYGVEQEKVEKQNLTSEPFRIKYEFHRLQKVKKNADRLNRYKKKIDSRKKTKLRPSLKLGKQVFVLLKD